MFKLIQIVNYNLQPLPSPPYHCALSLLQLTKGFWGLFDFALANRLQSQWRRTCSLSLSVHSLAQPQSHKLKRYSMATAWAPKGIRACAPCGPRTRPTWAQAPLLSIQVERITCISILLLKLTWLTWLTVWLPACLYACPCASRGASLCACLLGWLAGWVAFCVYLGPIVAYCVFISLCQVLLCRPARFMTLLFKPSKSF